MIPELFLIVSSTICVWVSPVKNGVMVSTTGRVGTEACVQVVLISTSQPVARDGETVYRVVPPDVPVGERSTICWRLGRHFWEEKDIVFHLFKPIWYCAICGKRWEP